MIRTAAAAACLLACAGAVSGQVVINEVYPNPGGPASTAAVIYEYIELYGEPGMDLTGYAIGQVIGGTDPGGEDRPNNAVEIDEAFTLDGLTIGPDGFLVIFNDDAGASAIDGCISPAGHPGAPLSRPQRTLAANPQAPASERQSGCDLQASHLLHPESG